MTQDAELETCRRGMDHLPSSEKDALLRFARDHSRTPRLKAQMQDGKIAISNSHPDQMIGILMLAEALGTGNLDFANGIIDELVDVSSFGGQLLENARLAANSNSLLERESVMQAHHKLSRNSATLAEVLHRLQSGQGQAVVQNVSNQSIVAHVTQVRSEQPAAAAPPVPDPELPTSENRARKRPMKERARSMRSHAL